MICREKVQGEWGRADGRRYVSRDRNSEGLDRGLSGSGEFVSRHPRRPMPILSSRDRTILALSPGRGFNSSLGSKLTLELLFPCSGCWFCSSLRSLASSNTAMSSEVIVIAVGFRRSMIDTLIEWELSGRRRGRSMRSMEQESHVERAQSSQKLRCPCCHTLQPHLANLAGHDTATFQAGSPAWGLCPFEFVCISSPFFPLPSGLRGGPESTIRYAF